jgi:hypothetical protein
MDPTCIHHPLERHTSIYACRTVFANVLPVAALTSMKSTADNHEEVLEVVDESGSILYTAERQRVHTDGLLHRAVYCFVFDELGQVLLQKRSSKCAEIVVTVL